MSWMQIMYLGCALILCTRPSNLFIRWFSKRFSLVDNSDDDSRRAGYLIGSLERILFLIFIVSARYEVAATIFAAKSILRFREGERVKTEYLLIGSLLSFLIVVILGIGYTALCIVIHAETCQSLGGVH